MDPGIISSKLTSLTNFKQKSSFPIINIWFFDDYCAKAISIEAIISMEKTKYSNNLGSLPSIKGLKRVRP